MTRFAAALVVAVAVAVMAPTGVATARSEPVSASELCYASRHNDGYQILDEVDTTDGGADSTLDIQVIDVSFDCASLDLTMSFVTTHEWSNAMLDRLDVGITTVDPRDASVGCDGSEFMAVVESDASGLTGSLYFVPVGGTCKNRDDWVRLDTVRVARPTARSVSIELGLPSIGLPSPLYWVAALHDVDDRTTGGSDFVPDPFSGADRQHLTEHPPTGGRSTVSRWYVTNDLIGGIADYSFDFAEVYDRDPYVGDWDGDGRSGVGFRRGDVFFIRNSLTTGIAENVIGYGKPGDDVFVGDWDGDGLDTL
ncbi:MAG: hypothetical protein OEU32_17880, partial [Acidimicrobiia bacterium]|nr:hypothetical protein [Acidimicrobiia bacterium]